MSSDDIKARNVNAIPKKTRQSNEWALGVWREWVRYRNLQPSTVNEPGFPIQEDVGLLNDEMLDYWGQRFIMEIRRKDGNAYPPNTLVQITSGIQRYLRNECGRVDINFMKADCPKFSAFRTALDTRMKELHAVGVGVSVNSSDPVTLNEELQLWDSGVFNFTTAEGLSNSVFFYNGKLFGFRGFQEHVAAQAEQFEIGTNSENGVRYLKYTPHLRKNSQGGLRNRRVNLDPIIHYEQTDRSVSIVELYSKYLSLIPRVGPLYRKPLPSLDENGNAKFSCGTISQSILKQMMKRFFEQAGIDMSGRKITNHSGRVTLCTTLYNQKFSDKAVKSRSKHRSDSVHAYQREQFQILNDISNCLEPPIKANSGTDFNRDSKVVLPLSKPSETVDNIDMKPPLQTVHVNAHEPNQKHTATDSSELHETLTIHVPSCVKKMIIIKNDGKRMILDV